MLFCFGLADKSLVTRELKCCTTELNTFRQYLKVMQCISISSVEIYCLNILLFFFIFVVVVVVVVVLLFYVHGKHLRSKVISGRSVNLTTLFLGRLRPPKRLTSTSCTYFRQ